MNRVQKEELVKSLNERFSRATIAVLTEFAGLSVAQMNKLRRELRQIGGEYKVAKNTLTRLAVQNTSYEVLSPQLDGQMGLAFGEGEAAELARVLVRFAEQHERFKVGSGALEGQVLEHRAIEELAKLPSREVLLGRVLAVMQGPATQLVRLMQEPATRMARLLAATERAQRAE